MGNLVHLYCVALLFFIHNNVYLLSQLITDDIQTLRNEILRNCVGLIKCINVNNSKYINLDFRARTFTCDCRYHKYNRCMRDCKCEVKTQETLSKHLGVTLD